MAGKVNKKKKRGGWDNTLTDLSKHQLSPAEIEKRKLRHVSKNLEAARKDLYEKPKTTNKSSVAMVTSSSDVSISNSQELLSTSLSAEHFMKAKCSKGHPNITPAPHLVENKENLERTLQELTYEGHPTALTSPGGIRDNSLLKRLENHQPPPTILNEVPPPRSHSPIPADTSIITNEDDPTYRPLINLNRYQSFVQDELKKVNNEVVDPITTLMKQLQVEVQEYEMEMGVVESTPNQQQYNSNIECVVKTSLSLVRYLRNAQRELKEERTLQEQLLLAVEDQQSILDTIATDVVQLKEKQNELETENKLLKEKCTKLENEITKVPPHFVPMFIPGPHPPTGPFSPIPMGSTPVAMATSNTPIPMGTTPVTMTTVPMVTTPVPLETNIKPHPPTISSNKKNVPVTPT